MFSTINGFVSSRIKAIELLGVMMRITSFTVVSWMGPSSPFMFVWIFNTIDAVLLTWCALLKRDSAYILLNAFWIMVGILGIARAGGFLA